MQLTGQKMVKIALKQTVPLFDRTLDDISNEDNSMQAIEHIANAKLI